jgi:cobyrinic acid a,c-diamide synthase
MTETRGNAIIIAGTMSGAGKTTVTLGLMAALARSGKKVQPFKCGPDFIDPSLHRLVTGSISRNLDIWMTGEDFTCQTYEKHSKNADISIIEGVMGMFDGAESSSAALAAKLSIPVILVLDVRSAAESAAAVLKGFESLEPGVAPRGVILNMIASQRHLELVSNAINKYCQAEILGYLPRSLNFSIPERHLGLHMGEEEPLKPGAVDELAEAVKKHINLERVLAMSKTIQEKSPHKPRTKPIKQVRIAIAMDKAFCFYYQDNLDLLKEAGAELVFFSPLHDKKLPVDIHGIYLGGGYPELHAKALSQNTEILRAIKKWAENYGPIYSECGGFMYLTQGIIDQDIQYPMAGIYPVSARMQTSRASLGYREIKLKHDCLLGQADTIMRGHEFHYSRIDKMPLEITRAYQVSSMASKTQGKQNEQIKNNFLEEGYCYKNVLGGYLHLHFGFSPGVVNEFIKNCKRNKKNCREFKKIFFGN